MKSEAAVWISHGRSGCALWPQPEGRPRQADFASVSLWPSRTKASNDFGLAPPIFSIVSVTAKRAASALRPAARSAFQSEERCSTACVL